MEDFSDMGSQDIPSSYINDDPLWLISGQWGGWEVFPFLDLFHNMTHALHDIQHNMWCYTLFHDITHDIRLISKCYVFDVYAYIGLYLKSQYFPDIFWNILGLYGKGKTSTEYSEAATVNL